HVEKPQKLGSGVPRAVYGVSRDKDCRAGPHRILPAGDHHDPFAGNDVVDLGLRMPMWTKVLRLAGFELCDPDGERSSRGTVCAQEGAPPHPPGRGLIPAFECTVLLVNDEAFSVGHASISNRAGRVSPPRHPRHGENRNWEAGKWQTSNLN